MHPHSEAHPFRDNSAGSEAKRRQLLRERRDDLATMNHEISRVYVARFSSLSAALALCLGGSMLVVASSSESLASALGSYMPGHAPAPLATLLLASWLLTAMTYLGARSLAEHRFNLAMSRAVLPTDDLHVDVARLSHEVPDAVGRRMAQRLETPSRLLAIIASGVAMPATILVGLLAIAAKSYPPVDQVESYLASSSTAFVAIAIMAVANALCIAARPTLHGLSLLVLSSVGCVVVAFVAPSALFYLVPTALCLAYLGFRTRRIHRHQNARIEQEGAPLPPAFKLRQRLRRAYKKAAALPALLTVENARFALRRLRTVASYRPSKLQLASVSMLLIGAAAIAVAIWPSQPASASARFTASAIGDNKIVAPASPDTPAQSYATRTDDGRDGLLIDLHFKNQSPIDASDLLSGATIPSGWRATITIDRLAGEGVFFVQALSGDHSPRQLTSDTPIVTIEQSNCGPVAMPLALLASTYGVWPKSGSATLRYKVRLEMLSGCSLVE